MHAGDMSDGDLLVPLRWVCPLEASWFLGHPYQPSWGQTLEFYCSIHSANNSIYSGSLKLILVMTGVNLNPECC